MNGKVVVFWPIPGVLVLEAREEITYRIRSGMEWAALRNSG